MPFPSLGPRCSRPLPYYVGRSHTTASRFLFLSPEAAGVSGGNRGLPARSWATRSSGPGTTRIRVRKVQLPQRLFLLPAQAGRRWRAAPDEGLRDLSNGVAAGSGTASWRDREAPRPHFGHLLPSFEGRRKTFEALRFLAVGTRRRRPADDLPTRSSRDRRRFPPDAPAEAGERGTSKKLSCAIALPHDVGAANRDQAAGQFYFAPITAVTSHCTSASPAPVRPWV